MLIILFGITSRGSALWGVLLMASACQALPRALMREPSMCIRRMGVTGYNK